MAWNNPFSQSNSGQNSGQNQSAGSGDSGWKNPFKGTQQQQQQTGADSKKPPEPTSAELVIDPAELRKNWDYKTATAGMFGESLPEGAERWTPYGTPYFGGGIMGKLKEYRWMFTRDSSGPSAEDWDNLWNRWGTAIQDVKAANASKNKSRNEALAEAKETGPDSAIGGLVVETVSKAWQTGTSSDNSVVSPVLRAIGVGVKGVMDLFGAPAIYLEQMQGAVSGVEETAEVLGLETLPDFFPDQDNWFTRFVNEQSTVRVADSLIKIAMSPRKDKWDVFNQNVREGWDAGRIFYSPIYDETERLYALGGAR